MLLDILVSSRSVGKPHNGVDVDDFCLKLISLLTIQPFFMIKDNDPSLATVVFEFPNLNTHENLIKLFTSRCGSIYLSKFFENTVYDLNSSASSMLPFLFVGANVLDRIKSINSFNSVIVIDFT